MNALTGQISTIPASVTPAGAAMSRPASSQRLSQCIVLREIMKARGPVRAYELARRLQFRMSRRISVNSVYRILGALELRDLVRRIESLKAWVAVPRRSASNSLHLICSGCGTIRSIAAPSVAEHLGRLAQSRRFAARRLVLETIGLCSRCASQSQSAQE